MNKKVLWSLAVNPVIMLSTFAIISCGNNSVAREPRTEAGRFQFLTFKKQIYDQRFIHKNAESFQKAIQDQNPFDQQKNLGLESVTVKLENGFFIVDFKIKFFSGTLEELNTFLDNDQPAKDSDPREVIENTFRIDTNTTNISSL